MNKDAYKLGELIVHKLNQKKIIKMDVLDVHELTPLADLFIIVVANNVKQTKALADDLEEIFVEQGVETVQKEGYHTATWILLDCGPVMVHILEEQSATFYGLERLWKDAPSIDYKIDKF